MSEGTCRGVKSAPWRKPHASYPQESSFLCPFPTAPRSHLGVDFLTDLPNSRTHTCICYRRPILQGVPPTAAEGATHGHGSGRKYYSTRSSVTSASRRTSSLTGALNSCPEFGGRSSRTWVWPSTYHRGFHPQTNGQTERKKPGDQPLPPYLLSRPPGLGSPSDIPAFDHWFRESKRVWGSAHHQLQRALRARGRLTADRRRSDASAYQPGQKVWLSTKDIRLRLPSRKLSPRFIGPFTILKQVNPVTYKPQLPRGYRIHPTFHVSLLKPHHSSVLPSTLPCPGEDTAEPPLPLLLDDGTAYGVKEILDSQRRGG
ncbi:hypothetical protein QTP86_014775 [Hemibagrus guttatus]|nr:hypothetical protein QTP86_014775 [Hemibagrus guttatus]